jgi:hypothetical protein
VDDCYIGTKIRKLSDKSKFNNMPVKPTASENESDFIGRCMSEEKESFPDQAQRYAVCKSKWDKSTMSKIKSTDKKVMARVAYDTKFEGINLGENSSACWENYIQVGTKMLDGREVPDCRGPIEAGINLQEDYPWETCIADQTERYGDEEIAKKVCGMIRSKYGR